jgi:hypothetical protein
VFSSEPAENRSDAARSFVYARARHANYKPTSNFEVFASINNRFLSPAAPIELFGGVRITF